MAETEKNRTAVTTEIDRKDWQEWLLGFTRQHRGWLVDVEVIGKDIGAQEQASRLPVQEVSARLKGEGKDEVTIILGRPSEAPWNRMIQGAARIRFEETPEGEHQALEIEGRDGVKTILKFRSGANPEGVDGILPS